MQIILSAEIIEAVISGFRKLIEYEIIQRVDTGNRAKDGILTALLISILAFVIAKFSYTDIVNKWKYKKLILTPDSAEYYSKIFEKYEPKPKISWWVTQSNAHEIVPIIFHSRFLNGKIYDCEKEILIEKNKEYDWVEFKKSLIENKYYPLTIFNNSIIYLIKASDEDIYLSSEKEENVVSFIKHIIKIAPKKDDNASWFYIYNFVESNSDYKHFGYNYKDQNFNKFFSKHKKDILSHLDNFIEMNNDRFNPKNPFYSFNLGFILHGPPGTGKTSLIKAISNYLQRNIVTVDMRLVKTKDDLEKLFKKYREYIYCFEEFDCIQGIIKQRSNEDSKEESNSEIENLNNRLLELLKISSEQSSTNINNEIEFIKNKIITLENKLTLDSILTVLDGLGEMRGRVIIATTNHIDKIDSALLRPGRFDMKIKLDNFDRNETIELLSNVFKPTEEEKIVLNNAKFQEYKYSPADIIQKCILKKKLDLVIEELIN